MKKNYLHVPLKAKTADVFSTKCSLFPLCPTTEFAEYHRRRSPCGKHSVRWRRGRRNLYHHRGSDKQSCKGQNSPASIAWFSNMHTILRGGTAGNRCVVVLQLLAVDGSALGEALTHKKLTAKGEEVTLPSFCLCAYRKFLFADWVTFFVFMLHLQMVSTLSFEQAVSSRDALAKATYSRTFTWLVEKINQSLAPKVKPVIRCDKKRKCKITRLIHSYSVFLCNAGWTPPQHKELHSHRASWYLWLRSPAAQQVEVTAASRVPGKTCKEKYWNHKWLRSKMVIMMQIQYQFI